VQISLSKLFSSTGRLGSPSSITKALASGLFDGYILSMKIRVGFIGAGAMGLSHVKSIHEGCGGQAEAVAICSNNETNIQKALAVAPGARIFKDEAALIESELDAVFISTPNFTHARLALAVLRAGKHLFLEKPVGISRDEARQVVEAVDKTDRVVMIGHQFRYSPYFQKIKAMVEAGEIGVPRMAWTREFRGPFQKKSQEWIQDDRRSGGGLVDKNCHQFDLMNWWIGARPKRVCAFGGCAVNRRIEGEHQVLDHATVSFEYQNGARGTLHLCMFGRDFPDEELEMGVIGDAGVLQTRISEIEILQWRRGANQKAPIVHQVAAKRGEGWGGHLGFADMHEAFVQAVLENKPPITSARECLDGTLLALAAEESIKRGSVVEI
jgi:predicted dehydrogenase